MSGSIIIENFHSLAQHLSPTHVCMIPHDMQYDEEEGKGHALDEEHKVDTPCTNCQPHSNLMSVPNSNAGRLNKRLIGGDDCGAEQG